MTFESWHASTPYEPFMGRWSRKIAPVFLNWLDKPTGLRWLDVGCGTGALSSSIAEKAAPESVLAIDPSAEFIAFAAGAAAGMPNLLFEVGTAEKIPAKDHAFDIAVSGLALNFFPDAAAGLAEIMRTIKPGGEVALYVWDYADGMQMLRYFWDAAISLDPNAAPLDEGIRFPICRPDALTDLFETVGLSVGAVRALETPAIFSSFSDYWQPFLGGVGPAPGYVAGLSPDAKQRLADRLSAALPSAPDGTIPLAARAWGIRGTVPLAH